MTVALAVSPDFPGDSMVVNKFLASKGFLINDVSGKSYESAVNSLTDAVASGMSGFGVCVERTGMKGPIFANRNRNIRAVHCRETLDARSARVDIGANVIVLDSVSNPEAVIGGFIGL
jgi:ribose 5-phosphate isomerase RpiB